MHRRQAPNFSEQVSRENDVGDSAPSAVTDRVNIPKPTRLPPKPPSVNLTELEAMVSERVASGGPPIIGHVHPGGEKEPGTTPDTTSTRNSLTNLWQSNELSSRLQVLNSKKHWEQIPISWHNYSEMCGTFWDAIVMSDSGLGNICSRDEFIHVSMLLLQYRVDYVQFGYEVENFDPLTSAVLPKNVRVFQPLWEILMGVGAVETETSSYLPYMCHPTSGEQDSVNDQNAIKSGIMYPWVERWNAILAARTSDTSRALTTYTSDYLCQRMADLSSSIGKIAELRAKSQRLESQPQSVKIIGDRIYPRTYQWHWRMGRVEYSVTEYLRRVPSYAKSEYYDKELDNLFREANQLKFLSTRAYPTVELNQFISASGLSATIEHGQLFHWDTKLMDNYQMFADAASKLWLFSISMPHIREGNASWLVYTTPVVAGVTYDVEIPFNNVSDEEIQTGSYLQMMRSPLSSLNVKSHMVYTKLDIHGFIYSALLKGRKPP